ncbi:MAG TPA: bifunctional lysylphosphatidylglycerol flippase/synthetase MprF [Thermodesulfobacteriota bacterium]|nr:bifunctional lysylphosphatidylglycerol flippase/synthetase MprF [Thermodesulfobacteriota bacterium]
MDDITNAFWSLPAQDLLRQLNTEPQGLTNEDARQRLGHFGENRLKPQTHLNVLSLFVSQFKSPIILILLFAAGLSFFLHDSTDALIILAIILISGFLGFWQEKGAAHAVENLLKIVQTKTKVLRDKIPVEIPFEEVVPGDIVLLSAGGSIPGDCILLESKDLFVDEATLTGETYPAEKTVGAIPSGTPLSQRANTVFMGTHVISGTAKSVVVHTGKGCEFGKVSERLKLRPPETEFERGVRRFGYFLLEVTLVLVIAIFAVNVFLGRHVLESLLFSLALAVGLTPQLLPAIISINLAQGAKRMASVKVIVRRLASIENFGSMDILCSDKTGTLTEGVVQLNTTLTADGKESEKILFYAYLNAFYETGFINPIDEAIRTHHHFDIFSYQKLDEVPYDFIRKRLSILVSGNNMQVIITKGALQNVLAVCSRAEMSDGALVPIDEVRQAIQSHYETFSKQGFRTLGMVALIPVGAFLMGSLLRKKPFRMGDWEFTIPSPKLFGGQMVVALLDWFVAGWVLYVLLPAAPNLSFPAVLGIFLLGQLVGLVSQVPGGLGVFETVVLFLLSPTLPASATIGSLLAYRGIYYLFPLLIATVILGSLELLQKKHWIQKIARGFGQWLPLLVPQVLAFATFIAGAILLFSGATPGNTWRFYWLQKLPLPVVEVSHFLGSVVGMGLLLLARGLQRRIDAAFVLTSTLLGAGVIFSFLKGLDYEEGVILIILLIALLPGHRYFYRRASIFDEKFTLGWIAAITLVLLCSVWLTMFSYRHVEYSNDLWWSFTLNGHASRSLRALVGSIGVALFLAVAHLLRPSTPKHLPTHAEEVEMVKNIIQKFPQTYAYLALLGDKTFLFNEKRNAFIMYKTSGRSWVTMGDPIGPEEERRELIWRFREMCDRYDGWTVFYEVGTQNIPLYLDLGLALLKIGEEGRVWLQGFSLEGNAHKGFRHTLNKLQKEGYLFEIVLPENIPSLLAELRKISDAWLKEKNTREKGFSLGFFDEEYLKWFPAAIIRKDEKIIAFANIWQGAKREELSLDLMRHLPDAPNGIMDYLFLHLMLWGKEAGYKWFSLGMTPFAGMEDHALAPLWSRLGALIFTYGEYFYNFQGLRQYKQKFDTQWEPKYIASPGGLALPGIITSIASLISGGMKGVITK